MTEERFAEALAAASAVERTGIGRLAEKSVHSVLKFAFEPHIENHEVPVGGYVADLVNENGIIEIQTRCLWRLEPKLRAFLEVCDVTVVHPITVTEWIIRTDPDTGEVTRRKSPRKAKPFDILPELTPLREFLHNPRFHVVLCMLEVERYDICRAGSRSRTHLDRVPLKWLGEIRLDCPQDYREVYAEMGNAPFTAAEFGKKNRRPTPDARNGLLTLLELGLMTRAGKRGRLGLYQAVPSLIETDCGQDHTHSPQPPAC